MQKLLSILLFGFIFFWGITPALNAQRGQDDGVDEYFDDEGSLRDKLWYGGGFTLGFSGSGDINVFGVGISPMVGYKVFEGLSIGPRTELTYTYIKGRATDLQIKKVNALSYSVGLFGRYKIFRALFAHVEFEFESNESAFITGNNLLVLDPVTNKVAKSREEKNNFFIGGGYTSSTPGSPWAYEILLLFNLNDEDDTVDLPFDIRFGVTYNF